MSGVRLFYIVFVWMLFSQCEGITTFENEKNLIGEEDRRGVLVKVNDQKTSEATQRGLWLIGQHQQPADYDSSGPGGYGYIDTGAYGTTGGEYNNYGTSGGGAYHKGPSFGHGYGFSGGGSPFGHGGVNLGHSGYGETGHGVSQGHDGYNKLALKKLLIPLAGLALLGAAAALTTNPVLLQLGTVHSGRRKRSTARITNVYPPNPWVTPHNIGNSI